MLYFILLVILAAIIFGYKAYKKSVREEEEWDEWDSLPDRIGRGDKDPRAKAIWAAFDSGRPVMWTEKEGMKFIDTKNKR